MVTGVKAQIHMDDNIIDNPELQDLLEKRQVLKAGVSEYRKVDKETKDKIRTVDADMPYRVGRFIISQKTMPPREVSFETNESIRISIKTVDE